MIYYEELKENEILYSYRDKSWYKLTIRHPVYDFWWAASRIKGNGQLTVLIPPEEYKNYEIFYELP